MKEYLYSIGIVDRRTGERSDLRVWGKNLEEATHKLTSALFDFYGEYRWTGTGPAHDENGNLISRESENNRPAVRR